jgi:hypothetical protein
MVEVLFILAFLGILYLEVIEILEKCQAPRTATTREVQLEQLGSS